MDPELERACGTTPSWVCERVFDVTDSRFLATVADRAFAIVVILFVAWVLTVIARRYLRRMVARVVAPDTSRATRQLRKLEGKAPSIVQSSLGAIVPGPDPRRKARARSISAVVGSTASVLIWTVALIIAIGKTGIDIGPLIAGAGIAGIALGFGAQTLVKDCITGLFVLLEDQFGIGDVVDLDEATGTVERITLRTTVLRGVDGTVWHVPNGEVRRVGNRSQLWSVAIVDVVVAYDSDLATVRTAIASAVDAVCTSDEWKASVIEAPQVLGVEAFGADGITVRVTVKTTPGAQWRLQRELREVIKQALDSAGIDTPFAQRTMWVRPSGATPSSPDPTPRDPPDDAP